MLFKHAMILFLNELIDHLILIKWIIINYYNINILKFSIFISNIVHIDG